RRHTNAVLVSALIHRPRTDRHRHADMVHVFRVVQLELPHLVARRIETTRRLKGVFRPFIRRGIIPTRDHASRRHTSNRGHRIIPHGPRKSHSKRLSIGQSSTVNSALPSVHPVRLPKPPRRHVLSGVRAAVPIHIQRLRNPRHRETEPRGV